MIHDENNNSYSVEPKQRILDGYAVLRVYIRGIPGIIMLTITDVLPPFTLLPTAQFSYISYI
jgi:hypothetical protein